MSGAGETTEAAFGRDHHANPEYQRIRRQRGWAMFQLVFAFVRAAAWTLLIALYLAGVPFTSHLFHSVAFVAVISLYANAATDLGIGIAAYAGVIGADSRADVYSSGDFLLRRILATVEALERRVEGE